ncbi:MAG: patatin family protein [Coriobacteriales bacterium]|jgi:predicted patatin/cPLA2 family phospholipase|nr:patatin family protein [Coriobacteriales bacterium]
MENTPTDANASTTASDKKSQNHLADYQLNCLPEELPKDLTDLYPGFGKPDTQPAWLGAQLVDASLVLEGGSMRGQFTAGILDYLMQAGLMPTTVLSVSASAIHAINYAAGMPGRSTYLNIHYAKDWRFFSARSWLYSRSLFDIRFSFEEIPKRLVPYDYQAFRNSPIRVFSASVDLLSGEPDYHQYSDLEKEEGYLIASASLPFVSKIVHVDGRLLLDGGMRDSTPIYFSQKLGMKKHIVILTQPEGYVKHKNRLVWLARIIYRKYPNFVDAIATRHLTYNKTYKYVKELENQGEAFVFRPTWEHPVKSMEHDRNKLYALYREGYEQARLRFAELITYLNND